MPRHPHARTSPPRAAVGGPALRGGNLWQAKADEMEMSKRGKEEEPLRMRIQPFLVQQLRVGLLAFLNRAIR